MVGGVGRARGDSSRMGETLGPRLHADRVEQTAEKLGREDLALDGRWCWDSPGRLCCMGETLGPYLPPGWCR